MPAEIIELELTTGGTVKTIKDRCKSINRTPNGIELIFVDKHSVFIDSIPEELKDVEK